MLAQHTTVIPKRKGEENWDRYTILMFTSTGIDQFFFRTFKIQTNLRKNRNPSDDIVNQENIVSQVLRENQIVKLRTWKQI